MLRFCTLNKKTDDLILWISYAFFFERSRLQNALAKKDRKSCQSAIKKIIQYMTLGIDVSSLFPNVIMVCEFIEKYFKIVVWKNETELIDNNSTKDFIINEKVMSIIFHCNWQWFSCLRTIILNFNFLSKREKSLNDTLLS